MLSGLGAYGLRNQFSCTLQSEYLYAMSAAVSDLVLRCPGGENQETGLSIHLSLGWVWNSLRNFQSIHDKVTQTLPQ
jgi:hypothetical protein